MSRRPPLISLDFASLPSEPRQRHELLVDVFGQYLMWLRNWTVEASHELAESAEARQKLGAIQRRKYEAVAALTPDQRDVACAFAEGAVDRFIQLFLTMLSGTGVDHQLGLHHAVRFRLEMEILRVADRAIVGQEVINRGGEKFFAEYWGRWKNRAGPERTAPG